MGMHRTQDTTEITCTDVSVEGDATYCILGPICSGSGSDPTGSLCPVKGDIAVKDCNDDTIPSWTSTGQCVAPANAICSKLKTNAWGCVFDGEKNTTENCTDSVTPDRAQDTAEITCTDVSVEGDATYCIQGPICSGSGSNPTGSLCPVKGDIAVKDCNNDTIPSWTSTGQCVAPVNATCFKLKTNAWGCVFDDKRDSEINDTKSLPPDPTQDTTETFCTDVSVEGDATYCIQGPICSGSGSEPTGSLCPVKGDIAVKDCNNDTIPSWTSTGQCVAPFNATCLLLRHDAWECVFGMAQTNPTNTVNPPASAHIDTPTPMPSHPLKKTTSTNFQPYDFTPAPTPTASIESRAYAPTTTKSAIIKADTNTSVNTHKPTGAPKTIPLNTTEGPAYAKSSTFGGNANTSRISTSKGITSSKASDALSSEAIAGIIIASIFLVIVIVGAVLFKQYSIDRRREEELFADLSAPGGRPLETDYAAM
ncbi:hypothetical protein Plhal304r1_c001g0000211 [Plasmopara halstedii]